MDFSFDLLARRRRPPLSARLFEAFALAALVASALLLAQRAVATASGLVALHREARATMPPLPARAEVEAFAREAERAADRMRRMELSFSRLFDALEECLPQGTAIRRAELSLSGAGERVAPRGALTAQAASFEIASEAAARLAAHPLFREVALRAVTREEGRILFRLEFRHAAD